MRIFDYSNVMICGDAPTRQSRPAPHAGRSYQGCDIRSQFLCGATWAPRDATARAAVRIHLGPGKRTK